MDLHELFNNIHPVSNAAIARVGERAELLTVKKGTSVIRQGEKAGVILFIRDGIFRVSHNCDGKERTFAFGIAGDPFTSVASYRAGEPSVYSFEAEVDSTAWVMPLNSFRELVDSDAELARWFLTLLLDQVHAFERRGALFGGLNATRKYEKFILNRPEIFRYVPAKYIAQYLDIAPETLSRIQASFSRTSRR